MNGAVIFYAIATLCIARSEQMLDDAALSDEYQDSPYDADNYNDRKESGEPLMECSCAVR